MLHLHLKKVETKKYKNQLAAITLLQITYVHATFSMHFCTFVSTKVETYNQCKKDFGS